jgi:hypothetical protein
MAAFAFLRYASSMSKAYGRAVGVAALVMVFTACGSESSGGAGVSDAGAGVAVDGASAPDGAGPTPPDAGCNGNGGGSTFDNVDGGTPEQGFAGQASLYLVDAKSMTVTVESKDNTVTWQKMRITVTRPLVAGKTYKLTANPTVAEGEAYLWYEHARQIDGANTQWDWASSGASGTMTLLCASDDISNFHYQLHWEGVEMVPVGAQTTGRPILSATGNVRN